MKSLSNNLIGSLIMTSGMLVYVLNDALMKMVGPEIGLFQSIFIRGLIVVSCFIFFGFLFKFPLFILPKKFMKLVLARGVIEVMLTCCFMTAIFNMPLANAIAILQAMPLLISLIASKANGENLTNTRLTVIIIGFLGVLIILQPGREGFNFYSIYALISVLLLVFRDLITSKMPKSIHSFQVAFFTAVLVTVTTGIACCFVEWTPVQLKAQLSLLTAAILIGMGYLASVSAVRIGEISFSAPFRYTSLLWAIILGALFFNELPSFQELLGSVIIASCGIYVILSQDNDERT